MGNEHCFLPKLLAENPDLEGLLYVDTEKIEELAESSGRESTAQVPPLFYISGGGLLNYFIDLQTKRDLDKQRNAISLKWGLKDDYNIITPGNYDTVRFPPPHYIAVYIFLPLSWGLDFPFIPFLGKF